MFLFVFFLFLFLFMYSALNISGQCSRIEEMEELKYREKSTKLY